MPDGEGEDQRPQAAALAREGHGHGEGHGGVAGGEGEGVGVLGQRGEAADPAVRALAAAEPLEDLRGGHGQARRRCRGGRSSAGPSPPGKAEGEPISTQLAGSPSWVSARMRRVMKRDSRRRTARSRRWSIEQRASRRARSRDLPEAGGDFGRRRLRRRTGESDAARADPEPVAAPADRPPEERRRPRPRGSARP